MKRMIPELVEDSLVVVIQLSFFHITLKCVVELLDTKKDHATDAVQRRRW